MINVKTNVFKLNISIIIVVSIVGCRVVIKNLPPHYFKRL